ncbi:MAG: RloB family protein [Pseudomonadota bacterium]
MPKKRRSFTRPPGERRIRKLFVIAAEGAVTEPGYFDLFNNQRAVIQVNCLKNRDKSSPLQVLTRMKRYLKEEDLKHPDEAWLVVDKDRWTDEQLTQLLDWSKKAENYGFALSNPKFEYWLLLHFEDGAGVASSRECSNRLKKHLPGYDKRFEAGKISIEMVEEAIRRARGRGNPSGATWPTTFGSTVYRLVESILRA